MDSKITLLFILLAQVLLQRFWQCFHYNTDFFYSICNFLVHIITKFDKIWMLVPTYSVEGIRARAYIGSMYKHWFFLYILLVIKMFKHTEKLTFQLHAVCRDHHGSMRTLYQYTYCSKKRMSRNKLLRIWKSRSIQQIPEVRFMYSQKSANMHFIYIIFKTWHEVKQPVSCRLSWI